MIEQGTLEWHELRKGKVTASRVADVMAKTKTGVSASRGNYLIELALQRMTGIIEEGFKNDAMAHGSHYEDEARLAYEVSCETFVEQVAFVDHPTIPWFGCSPDGLVGEGLIEIKCPYQSAVHWSYLKEGKPPAKYIPQMMAQMSCTGAKWVDFVSYDPRMSDNTKLFIVRLDRDENYIQQMETEIKKFLDEVENEVQLMKEFKNGISK